MPLIAETLMFGLGLFFVLKLVSTLLLERQAKEELAAAHEQLRQYALQIEELAAVQERNHIAREIHDSLGHALTAQNIQLQTAVKLWQHDPNKAHSFLQQAQQLAATDQTLMSQGLKTMLELEPDLCVVGIADNGEVAIQQVVALQPGLVLMDMRMPVMDGRAATRAICQLFPAVKVLVLSTFDDDEYISDSIRAGAKDRGLNNLRRLG